MKYAAIIIALLIAAGLAWMLWPSGGTTAPTQQDIATAATLRPDNPALAAIYDRSCVSCHSIPDALAPLTGHAAGWAPRVEEKGIDGLVLSAQMGFGNMPAMGLCNDCTAAEFRGLIDFMSGASQ